MGVELYKREYLSKLKMFAILLGLIFIGSLIFSGAVSAAGLASTPQTQIQP